ncbi:hypothetical protein [Roseivivax sp. THAF197b]|uniref:hypothetical protein n=2 Tax=unclassified Roseivivax TaxID=2639302 RepID=UPI001268D1D3|nr:hypothetical protein [Roseivivax sp. THAF197b]
MGETPRRVPAARLKGDRVSPLVNLLHKVRMLRAEGGVSGDAGRASKADVDFDIGKNGMELTL